MKMKFFFQISVFFLCSIKLIAQVDTSNWTSHFAYNKFVDIASSSEKVYVAASNSVFTYNLDTNQVEKFTTVEGLSAEDISVIHYSETYSSLIIGYENGLIEILNETNGEISSFVDIQDQTNILSSSLKINNFFEDEETLYIATGFGVVVFNLSTGFFGDTYFISDSQTDLSDVLSVGVLNDQILASIVGRGTFVANRNEGSSLLNFSNWSNIQVDVFNDIVKFGEGLVAQDGTVNLYSFNSSVFESVYMNSENIFNIQVNNDKLTLTHNSGSTILDSSFLQTDFLEYITDESGSSLSVNNSILISNELFYDVNEDGFYKTVNQNFDNSLKISPEGPQSNSPKKLDLFEGNLWISHETVSVGFNDDPPTSYGVDSYINSNWNNISLDDLGALSITDVDVDRNNKDLVYISSYRNGLIKYENNNLEGICNTGNSDIEPSLITTFDGVYSTYYDENNDELWVVDPFTRQTLKKIDENCNKIDSVDLTPVIGETNRNYIGEEILIDTSGNIFLGTYRDGLIAYSQDLEEFVELSSVELHNMPNVNVKELALDKNGILWVGTVSGLRIFSNPNQIFIDGNIQAESIIFEEDGIARELLFEQVILDIKVDENNNKWIATNDGGVFYVSEDGQETIYNFTTENSPLPSNIVADIAIDESTGSVFFATEKGLMEFNSNITSAAEDLSSFKVFPNPVRPEYGEINVTIQGLTSGANVKITDIEGNLVYEAQNETFDGGGSGTILWDTRSFSGNKVATGVYLLLITAEDMVETKVEKLLIVR